MVFIGSAAAVWAAVGSFGMAQIPTADRVTASVTPEISSVVLGEPLQVSLTLHNIGPEEVMADLGADRKEAITLFAHLPDGSEKIGRISPHGGLLRIGKIRLQPGESYSQHLIIDEWLDLSAIGVYAISISLDNNVTSDGDSFTISPAKITATVLQRSEVELTRFCADSLNRMVSSVTYEQALDAAEVLGRVHDPAAVPYLKKAFGNRYRLDALFARGLEAIGSDDAIRALADVAEAGQTSESDTVNASLRRLAARTNNRALRLRIQAILDSGR
jgi:hypothetical protein